MKNVAILLNLIIDLSDRFHEVSNLLKKAREEGRDVTEDELNSLRAKDDASRDRLQKLIDEKRAEAEG